MKKQTNGRVLGAVTAILVAALIAVTVLILYKQHEYSASEDYYSGLRGGLQWLGRSLQ